MLPVPRKPPSHRPSAPAATVHLHLWPRVAHSSDTFVVPGYSKLRRTVNIVKSRCRSLRVSASGVRMLVAEAGATPIQKIGRAADAETETARVRKRAFLPMCGGATVLWVVFDEVLKLCDTRQRKAHSELYDYLGGRNLYRANVHAAPTI